MKDFDDRAFPKRRDIRLSAEKALNSEKNNEQEDFSTEVERNEHEEIKYEEKEIIESDLSTNETYNNNSDSNDSLYKDSSKITQDEIMSLLKEAEDQQEDIFERNKKVESIVKTTTYEGVDVVKVEEEIIVPRDKVEKFLNTVVQNDNSHIIDPKTTPSTEEYIKIKEKENKENKIQIGWTKHGKWLFKAVINFFGALILGLILIYLLVFHAYPSFSHMIQALFNLGFNTHFKDYLLIEHWNGGIPILWGPGWAASLITILTLLLVLSIFYVFMRRLYFKSVLNFKTYKELRAVALGELTDESRDAFSHDIDAFEERGNSSENRYAHIEIDETEVNKQFENRDILVESRSEIIDKTDEVFYEINNYNDNDDVLVKRTKYTSITEAAKNLHN